MNLSDKQREEVLKIIELGSVLGGSKEIDGYLMQQMMGVLMPETDKIDELSSLYDITGEESLKDEILNEYYKKQGIDPQKKAQEEALLATFNEKYPTEQSNDKRAYENTQFQTMMQQSPEMLSQFYQGAPERDWSSPISAIFSGESEKQKRERLRSLLSQYQSNLPRQ